MTTIFTHDIYALAKALGGIPLLGCIPGSPSHRAGLRFGDIILRTNGVDTDTLDAYVSARKLGGDVMTVTYFRDGEEHEVSLDISGPDLSMDQVETFFEKASETLVAAQAAQRSRGEPEDSC